MKVGVRQGGTLSPLLFINGIVQKVKEDEDGGELRDLRNPVLLFTNDMVLMAEGEEELERMVRKVTKYSEEWTLDVNDSTTQVMVVCKNGEKVAKTRSQCQQDQSNSSLQGWL
jgi:hypothetical protein